MPGDSPQVQAELGGTFAAPAGRVICRAGSQGLEEHGKSRHLPAPTSGARQGITMGLSGLRQGEFHLTGKMRSLGLHEPGEKLGSVLSRTQAVLCKDTCCKKGIKSPGSSLAFRSTRSLVSIFSVSEFTAWLFYFFLISPPPPDLCKVSCIPS